jgi:hypothetical protein
MNIVIVSFYECFINGILFGVLGKKFIDDLFKCVCPVMFVCGEILCNLVTFPIGLIPYFLSQILIILLTSAANSI